ncbi:MAG: hypothetical protein IAE79_17890 [Anaerolinea sp.]|nr:hypothetical protein [Anaerolinea sp.]
MQSQGKYWLTLGGVFSIGIAILHIAIIFGGAPAYRYFGAGEEMAQKIVWMINSPKSVPSYDVLFSLESLLVGIIYFVGTISSWKVLKANSRIK